MSMNRRMPGASLKDLESLRAVEAGEPRNVRFEAVTLARLLRETISLAAGRQHRSRIDIALKINAFRSISYHRHRAGKLWPHVSNPQK